MNAADATEPKSVYWRRELPPFDARPMGEHVVEASSAHVPDTIAHRDELWRRCEDELMANARAKRLRASVAATLTSCTNRSRRGTTPAPAKPGSTVALRTCCTDEGILRCITQPQC